MLTTVRLGCSWRRIQRFHQIRPDTLQFAIAFASVFGSKSFALGFTFALFFGDASGCRPGFEISWLRDGVGNCAAGLVFPGASCTTGSTGMSVGDANPTLDWGSMACSNTAS